MIEVDLHTAEWAFANKLSGYRYLEIYVSVIVADTAFMKDNYKLSLCISSLFEKKFIMLLKLCLMFIRLLQLLSGGILQKFEEDTLQSIEELDDVDEKMMREIVEESKDDRAAALLANQQQNTSFTLERLNAAFYILIAGLGIASERALAICRF